MRKILVLGAGKSSSTLIDYILNNANEQNWSLTLADIDIETARKKLNGNSNGEAVKFDLSNNELKTKLISDADIVVSMLPARFHVDIAKECIRHSKNLVTPSYVSKEMKALHQEVSDHGLLFLNELGVDPGIDHMSAMKIIDKLKGDDYTITGFESFTGGLIAPESDNNPWHYKFTWNPMNVVLAGQGDGGVKFLHNGKFKYIPYHKLFERTEIVEIEDFGEFEGYANRDSLKYIDIYGLHDLNTMYRGTFRKPKFCRAWNILVQLGVTDNSYQMEDTEEMTYREFINSFLKFREGDSVELKLAYYLHLDVDSDEMNLIKWLGLFKDEKIGLKNATPAQILLKKLKEKWSLEENDKDMIVMWHKFNAIKNGKEEELHSSLVVTGDDQVQTAMSKTVGLPVGIATKLILNGNINLKGVHIPIHQEIYDPVLNELEDFGISFKEKKV